MPKWSALAAQNTAPLGSDKTVILDDPAGTPASQYIYLSDINLLPQGHGLNYSIVRSVASNNLTISIKDKGGNNFTTTNPWSIWIGGTMRRGTATLSKTWNAGTNWAALGSTETAAQDVDIFLYVIWNTGPGTDIIDFGWSRWPGGRVYSDFSATSTNEKYLAYANATSPAATDNVELIGRVNVTLSAAAAYNWSVPATDIIVHRPIDYSRWLTFTPTMTSASGTITTVGAISGNYHVIGPTVFWEQSGAITTNGTGAGAVRMTLPFSPATNLAIASGRENQTTGNMLQGYYTSNYVQWTLYDNSYPGADSRTVIGSGLVRW